jgi:hypothetical protein
MQWALHSSVDGWRNRVQVRFLFVVMISKVFQHLGRQPASSIMVGIWQRALRSSVDGWRSRVQVRHFWISRHAFLD